MLNEKDQAPDFKTKDQNGSEIKLSDYGGQKLVLYFYPKDDTPGCTRQACSLRDGFAEFEKRGIKIFGISTDDEKSHQKFIAKYDLPFDLLADTDRKIVNDYGVYGEKTNYGKKYTGINRTTFLIDETGKIVRIFRKIKVDEHAAEILTAFEETGK